MTFDRLKVISENLIDHLSESLGHDGQEELNRILTNAIGMTEEEIEELTSGFSDIKKD